MSPVIMSLPVDCFKPEARAKSSPLTRYYPFNAAFLGARLGMDIKGAGFADPFINGLNAASLAGRLLKGTPGRVAAYGNALYIDLEKTALFIERIRAHSPAMLFLDGPEMPVVEQFFFDRGIAVRRITSIHETYQWVRAFASGEAADKDISKQQPLFTPDASMFIYRPLRRRARTLQLHGTEGFKEYIESAVAAHGFIDSALVHIDNASWRSDAAGAFMELCLNHGIHPAFKVQVGSLEGFLHCISSKEKICSLIVELRPDDDKGHLQRLQEMLSQDMLEELIIDTGTGTVPEGTGLTGKHVPSNRKQCVYVWGRYLEQHMPPWLCGASRELGLDTVPVDPAVPHVAAGILGEIGPEDILLIDKGDYLTREVLGRVKGQKILYYPDILPSATQTNGHARGRYSHFAGIAPYCDQVFLHDTHALEFLKSKGHSNLAGIVILPYQPGLHEPCACDLDTDLIFIGHISPHRKSWLDIIGAARQISTPSVWGRAMVDGIRKARISLNIHYTPIPNTEHRFTESMACGCFILTEIPTMTEFFRDGEHLVYMTPENVLEKIDYYLSHEKERTDIAKAGMAYVRSSFPARTQLEKLLGRIEPDIY